MTPDELREWGRARGVFWSAPPRGTCPDCKEANAILHDRAEYGLEPCCAHCYRVTAVRSREQACDDCGKGPAFRDPGHRRNEYRCLGCHAKVGYTLNDAGMLRKLIGMAGPTHSKGRSDPCIAKGGVTQCHGQVKPRGSAGVMCQSHFDPVKYAKARQS